ncbi:hypothetical protein Tco_0345243 [Tanacetum coccineum]
MARLSSMYILKRLVPNGFEKVYYCKSGAKLTSIRKIKSDQDIVDLLKVGYDNGFQIGMYLDHFGYDIMEMVEYDRNEKLRKTRIKAELDSSDDDYHYSDDDLEEIENVDFHTEGDDSLVIKNITTQDPFLTKLCSARILFRGNVEYGLNEETPQVDPDDNQIDHVYKVRKEINIECCQKKVRTSLFKGDEGNQASKKPVKKHVKKPVNKKPDSQSGEGTSQSPKWTKKQIQLSKKVNYPFRLYAS